MVKDEKAGDSNIWERQIRAELIVMVGLGEKVVSGEGKLDTGERRKERRDF